MTCIAAWAENGCVWMGGDSASVGGWNMHLAKEEKVFVNGDFLIGGAGSWRDLQLLKYALEVPPRAVNEKTETYMVLKFIEATRKCLKDYGSAEKKYEQERFESHLMVGYQGRIFVVCGDYQIIERADSFAAVGCGESFALGALRASAVLPLTPEERITIALDTAEAFSAGVRRPFHIIKKEWEI